MEEEHCNISCSQRQSRNFEFKQVVPDCCLGVECQPGDRGRVNEFLSSGMAGGPPQAKAPLSDRSWDKRWGSTTSTKGKARSPSGSKPHGEGRASEGKWRSETTVLGGVQASPSTAVAGGQGSRSKSRRCHRSRNRRRERSSSGESVAGSARSRGRARGGNFRGVVGPEPGDYAVQILGMGKDRNSSWSTSVRLRNLKGYKAALHREEWTVVPRGAVRGVDGQSAKANARIGKDLRPGTAEVGPALFGQVLGGRWVVASNSKNEVSSLRVQYWGGSIHKGASYAEGLS